MCGIAGVFNYQDRSPINEGILKEMASVIAHRGPDGEGFYLNEEKYLGLCHRRLSIIDLAGGHQPMCDVDETVWIVFNGEIYNYKELKQELLGLGYKFKTNSDTEVIINFYKEYGEEGLERLNGMFAFALYDLKKKEILLARDHFGVKPLYYIMVNGSLVFGSEIKSILKHPKYQNELDLNALGNFLTFRYNPAPKTLFKGIKKLEAAHYIKLDLDGNFQKHNYWDYKPELNHDITESEAIVEYQRLLEQAVKRQMVSDVPVGLFLSGGIDSAVIGYLMQKNYSEQVKTYSVGFAGKGAFNELDDAKATAKFIGSEHYEYSISKKEYLDFFIQSFKYTEEPIAEPTIPALNYVARLARQHGKVVLSGQGADEPLAGYRRYFGEKYLSKYNQILRRLPLESISNLLPRNEKFRRASHAVKFTNEIERFLAIYAIFTPAQKEEMLEQKLQQELINDDLELINRLYSDVSHIDDSLSKILYIDTRKTLSDNLLIFGDKITMANSLECRVPFLDIDLVKFLESLPSKFKLNGSTHKYIHKKALNKWLPDEIINRKKRAFATPMDDWLQNELADKFTDLINESDSACQQYFNIGYISNLIEKHKNRKENYYRQIYALFSFELWYRYFMKDTLVEL